MSGRVIVRREAALLVLELALADAAQLVGANLPADPIPESDLTPMVLAAEAAFTAALYDPDHGLCWGAAADPLRNDLAMATAEGAYVEAMNQQRAAWLADHVEDDPDQEE